MNSFSRLDDVHLIQALQMLHEGATDANSDPGEIQTYRNLLTEALDAARPRPEILKHFKAASKAEPDPVLKSLFHLLKDDSPPPVKDNQTPLYKSLNRGRSNQKGRGDSGGNESFSFENSNAEIVKMKNKFNRIVAGCVFLILFFTCCVTWISTSGVR